ncbi:MAG: hypothetical protein KJ737_10895 [Proteobacteria bacterium]|nr:hypothetical protein [Pseudomonadota bacterium]
MKLYSGKKKDSGQYMEISETPPFSLTFYNTLLEAADALLQQKETINTATALSKRAVEDALIKFDEMKKQIRQVKDMALKDKHPIKSLETVMKIDAEASNADLAEALLIFEKLKYQNVLKEADILDL